MNQSSTQEQNTIEQQPPVAVAHPRHHLPLAGLALLLLIHAAANVWWVQHDHHLLNYDEIEHLTNAQRYHDALFGKGSRDPLERLVRALEVDTYIYPPLQYILGAAALHLLGDSTDALALTNTAVFLFFIAGVYVFSRAFNEPWESLYVAFTASLIPGAFGMSRLPLTDLLAAALVVWCFCALSRTHSLQNTPWVFLLAIFNGLGFLARWVAFLAYAPAVIVAALCALARVLFPGTLPRQARHPLRNLALNLAIFSSVSVGIAAPWYLLNLERLHDEFFTLRDHAVQPSGPAPTPRTSSGPFLPLSTSRQTDSPHPAEPPSLWASLGLAIPGAPPPAPSAARFSDLWNRCRFSVWVGWLVAIVNGGVFLPTFLLGIVGVFALVKRRGLRFPSALVLLWFPGGYIAMALARTLVDPLPRYALPLLPAFAPLCAAALFAIPPRWLRRASLALFACLLLLQYGNLTFGPLGPAPRLDVPILRDLPLVEKAGGRGLAILSDRVVAGAAAVFAPPQRGMSWTHQAFLAIERTDRERLYTNENEARLEVFRCPEGYRDTNFGQVTRSWPRLNPTLDHIERVCGFVGPLSPVFPDLLRPTRRPAPTTSRRLYTDVTSPFPLFRGGDHTLVSSPADLEVPFPASATLDAIALRFPDPAHLPGEYVAAYLDPASGQYVDFTPPVVATEGLLQDRFHRFESVEVAGVRFRFSTALNPDGAIAVCSPEFYRLAPQQRPIIISRMHRAGKDPSSLGPRRLEQRSYVVFFGELQKQDNTMLRDLDLIHEGLAAPANHPYAVFAQKQRPLISYATNPGFRVAVSDDLAPNGRWDLPWWRFHRWDTTVNPPNETGHFLYYWATTLPGIADVSLGGVFDVTCVEIIPCLPNYGLEEAHVQFWDLDDGTWRSLNAPGPILLPPQYEADGTYRAKGRARMWEEPVPTDSLRFIFLKGAKDEPRIGYVGNIFIYGDPVPQKTCQGAKTKSATIEDVFSKPASRELRTIEGPESIAPGEVLSWNGPVLTEGETAILEFGAISTGSGTLTLSVNDETTIVFRNARGEDDVWIADDVTLAYRAGRLEASGRLGLYRLVLPARCVLPGSPTRLRARLTAQDTRSRFALRVPQSWPALGHPQPASAAVMREHTNS